MLNHTETHASSVNRENADELAEELGMMRSALEAGCHELCGCAVGAQAFPVELPLPPRSAPYVCNPRY